VIVHGSLFAASTDIEWLLEEIYIFRPLDDDRIALTPRA
jgi:hypothetical protein